jgi:hypothetical protein
VGRRRHAHSSRGGPRAMALAVTVQDDGSVLGPLGLRASCLPQASGSARSAAGQVRGGSGSPATRSQVLVGFRERETHR